MSDHSAVIEFMKNRAGIDEPEENATDTYERGKRIVPDCIETNDNEIPVRQYDLAVLQTKLKFMRAEGRLQVTNQRLIFRATGRSLRGRTTLQHHFKLDEIAGIEARKDYRFAVMSLLIGALAIFLVGLMFGGLSYQIYMATPGGIGFAVVMGIAGVVPLFILHKKFLIKLLCCSAGFGSLFGAYLVFSKLGSWLGLSGLFMLINLGLRGSGGFYGSDWFYAEGKINIEQMNSVLLVGSILAAAACVVALLLFAFKPNLVFTIKTKGGTGAVEIRRKSRKEEYTGYEEVLPWKDTEGAIREVGAMIHDIQTMGKHGIDKWKETDEEIKTRQSERNEEDL